MQVKLLNEAHGEKTFALVFEEGEEAVAGLADAARRHDFAGAYFTAIGALSGATLGFFDPARKDYRKIAVAEQVEVVSLVGNIAMNKGEPKVHAHMVVAKADGTALGGHMLEAHVRPTLEVVLIETPRHLRRKTDEATGLALLDLG